MFCKDQNNLNGLNFYSAVRKLTIATVFFSAISLIFIQLGDEPDFFVRLDEFDVAFYFLNFFYDDSFINVGGSPFDRLNLLSFNEFKFSPIEVVIFKFVFLLFQISFLYLIFGFLKFPLRVYYSILLWLMMPNTPYFLTLFSWEAVWLVFAVISYFLFFFR